MTEEKKMNFKKKNGITLIALVVTIIVLLILAGISISMLTGQNGILNRASEAKEKTEVAQKDENEKMQGYEDIINKYTGNLPSKEETKPYFPSSTFSYKEGDLNTGLVIRDADGNEYVWVEVPKTTTVYSTAGINITNFTDEEYTKIEADLHTYTSDYRKETNYSDTYATDATSGWFADALAYNTAKKKMLKSVYQNGGFWVGRYEAGITENRTVAGEANKIPVTKKNLYPYNFVTRTQAKVLAEQVESGNYTSSLMFGVQWDLILSFIGEKTAATAEEANKDAVKTQIIKDLKNDSTNIGVYNNKLWNITNVNAKYSIDYGFNFNSCPNPYQKTSNEPILLTTGADESFSLMNIYDIAGNVWEWTLEYTSDSSNSCAGNGGGFNNWGTENSASSRRKNDTSSCFSGVGFRISLY